MDKAWITLFVAGIMEVVWATALDYSDGFTIWYFDILVVVFLVINFATNWISTAIYYAVTGLQSGALALILPLFGMACA